MLAVPQEEKDNTVAELKGGKTETVGDKTTVSRNIDSLKSQGIEDIKSQNGNANVTYSAKATQDKDGNYKLDSSSIKGKMNTRDSQNVMDYVNAFKDPNSSESEYYRKQGIDNARVNSNGNIEVSYNKKGQKKLGYDSIKTVGSGDDARVIETKTGDNQNKATKKTFDITKADEAALKEIEKQQK